MSDPNEMLEYYWRSLARITDDCHRVESELEGAGYGAMAEQVACAKLGLRDVSDILLDEIKKVKPS